MRLLFLFLLSILTIGFLLPTITSIDNSLSNFLLTKVYSTVCHQESAKCISIGGASMLVCARCAGIYAGALVSGLFSLLTLVRPISTKVLILSVIPLVIDVFFTFTGVYNYSQSIAFASGLAFGGILYLLVIAELENLFSNKSFKGNE
ncbi:MAG: DUF2085 domain-containing protein [Ignavibacteriaceae bacterium]|jgi:uncharacterized membrane protein|nr:DUF2085 domain-containing protein [Ignavibacteriaceae bacterium]MCU0413249.1 DUF2085 domain-containing protein [Ignavibacteriaceae bacterium]